MFLKTILAASALIIVQQACAVDGVAPATDKFITVSDVHFDPFVTCRMMAVSPCPLMTKLNATSWQGWEAIFESADHSKPANGTDTNYSLLKSSIAALKKTAAEEHARFAFFLGDFLAHNYRVQYALYSHDVTKKGYQEFVKKTYQFLVHEYVQALPEMDIYPALGNNDAYEDYAVVPGGKLLHQQADIWAGLIHDKTNREIFTRRFPVGGYYSVMLPQANNQRLIVLDSVLFSRHISGDNVGAAAQMELAWLHDELAKASDKHENVIIAYHIPIGVDVYATLKSFLKNVEEFWQHDDNVSFEAAVKQYAGIIKIILAGHIHMDNFEIMNRENLPVALSFTPAISPIYGNNSGFKVFEYDSKTLAITNYNTYYFPLSDTSVTADPEWKKEYSFKHVYQSSCNDCEVVKGMTLMTPRGESTSFFKLFYGVSSAHKSIEQTFNPYYWCGTQALSDVDWVACTQAS